MNGPTALVVAIIVFLVLLIGWAFLIPALFFLFDLLILLVITLIGGAVRVLFRRPWKIEARTGGADRRAAQPGVWSACGGAQTPSTRSRSRSSAANAPDQIRLDR